MNANSKTPSYGAVALSFAAAALAIIHFTDDKAASPAAGGITIVPSQPSSRPSSSVPLRPGVLPPQLASALKLDANAKLRDALPATWQKGILCGQVSRSGGERDYRRFVYNGPGGTGAIDDGSDLFRKFADKICLLQPKAE